MKTLTDFMVFFPPPDIFRLFVLCRLKVWDLLFPGNICNRFSIEIEIILYDHRMASSQTCGILAAALLRTSEEASVLYNHPSPPH